MVKKDGRRDSQTLALQRKQLFTTRRLRHYWEDDFWSRYTQGTGNQSLFHYEGLFRDVRIHKAWWGNQTRAQFELAVAVSYKYFFFSLSYFILRVIIVRQEVIENVDSFESKWKWLAWLKCFSTLSIWKMTKPKPYRNTSHYSTNGNFYTYDDMLSGRFK